MAVGKVRDAVGPDHLRVRSVDAVFPRVRWNDADPVPADLGQVEVVVLVDRQSAVVGLVGIELDPRGQLRIAEGRVSSRSVIRTRYIS